MAATEKQHVLEEDEDEEKWKSTLLQHKVKMQGEMHLDRNEMLKYLNESLFHRTPLKTPDGVKCYCTTTEKYIYKKKTQLGGRKKGREHFHVARRQGEKQKERCANEQPVSQEPLPTLSRFSFALLFACPLQPRCQKSQNQQEKEGERGHNGMREQKKTTTFSTPFTLYLMLLLLLVSSQCCVFNTSMGVGMKC